MSQLQEKSKSTQDTSQIKKRVVLTHAQKRQLCLDHQKTPQPTQDELGALYDIRQNTVSDILKKKDKWLLVNPDSEEANKQIARASAGFPPTKDLFFYGKQKGDSYTVGCWINETTTIRVSE